ncbi:MAG: hypothetical protein ACE5HF_08815 [Gemmatimonadota bacterium]
MSLLDVMIRVSLVLWIALGFGMILMLVIVGPKLGRMQRRYDRLLDSLETKVTPLLEQAERITDNATYITGVLRDDVETIDRTVQGTAESLTRMIALAEDRISDINALVTVAQEEAEETFFSTAALVRALRGGRRRRKKRLLQGRERRRFG